jgi:NADH-quinone oxidoreductase subunit M
MLSLLIFIPLLALIPVFLLPAKYSAYYKFVVLGAMVFECIVAFLLYVKFISSPDLLINGVASKFKLMEKANWISLDLGGMGKVSVDYFLGVDGLNIFMILLSAFVLLIGVLSSWNIEKKLKGYFCLYLLLSSSIMGCFLALDFFLFFLFFELMLLPMYFLIGLWGGPKREYASIKFFLYTLAGSLLILIVMITLYISVIDPVETALNLGFINNTLYVSPGLVSQVQTMLLSGDISNADKVHTFNILYMTDPGNYVPGSLLHILSSSVVFGMGARHLAFLAIFIGFAIKMPSVPFHTWLPDAHVEAPTPIFPEGAMHYAKWIALLGVISIIYGAFNALAMKDIKKMIAYSSVSHMGFVLLGIASVTVEGMNGAIYQMFSHGILTTMLFLIAGVLYDRTHDRTIDNYRGLASRMPNYTIIVTVAFFASLGLPGFSGFIAELFVLLGAFHSYNLNGLVPRWMAVAAVSGILIGAAYYLWILQKMFFGKFWIRTPKFYATLKDLDQRELIMLVPLIVITIIFGLFPGLLFDLVAPSVSDMVSLIMHINPNH